MLKEAGYPDGFETTLWSAFNHITAQKVIQSVQQQLGQVGIKVNVRALEAGQRVALVESVPDAKKAEVRMYYVGWSASTMEPDFALTPLVSTQAWPPKQFNTAYYSNPLVDEDLKKALQTTDREAKAKIYKAVQDQVWADAPWAFLVTEKVLYVHNNNLSGVKVMPDGSFNFEEIDLADKKK